MATLSPHAFGRLFGLVSFAAAVVSPRAQVPVQFIAEPSEAVVFAVALDGGHDTDADAAVLAECRLRAARMRVPEATACGHRVVADTAVLFVVVAPDDWRQGEQFVRALLAPTSPLDDDELALAIAHCALQADDAAFVYPGDVLAGRVRARLAARQGASPSRFPAPLAGDPQQVAAITPQRVRARLGERVRAAALVLGAVSDACRQAFADGLAGEPLSVSAASGGGAVAGEITEAAGRSASVDQAAMPSEPHERIDAPFVAAGFLAPSVVDGAFVLGVQVARARAARRFGARRSGVLAHAPFVAWSWFGGDAVVVFHRRGPDPVERLPGEREGLEAADVAAATRIELQALLDDLVAVPPTAEELAAARAAVQVERGVPADSVSSPMPAPMLPGRAMARLLTVLRPAVVANLDTVDATAVSAAMRACLARERACWHALLPLPRADRTWPRR